MRNVSFSDTNGTVFNQVDAIKIDGTVLYYVDPYDGSTQHTDLPVNESERLRSVVPSANHPSFYRK